MRLSFFVTCLFMAWLMNINIVTVTPDLIFKRFAFQPVLKSKRIIPFNPTAISDSQQGGSLHYKSTTKSLGPHFFQCFQILLCYLPTDSHCPRSIPWIGRINIINMPCIELNHIRTNQITIEMFAYQWIFSGLNHIINRTILVTRM